VAGSATVSALKVEGEVKNQKRNHFDGAKALFIDSGLMYHYDFKKMLESCPQGLYDWLPIPILMGILVRVEFLAS
jgi:hypothetical protein